MLINKLFLLALSVVFLSGCSRDKGKTEIKAELSEAGYFYSLSDYSQDSIFLSAYNFVRNIYRPEKDDFVDLFSERLKEEDPEIRLAAFFSTFKLKDKINYTSTNQQVIDIVKEEIKEGLEETILILKGRIIAACEKAHFPGSLFDRPAVEVISMPERNSYLFTVNRATDHARMIKQLESPGDFGIWATYPFEDLRYYMANAYVPVSDSLFFSMINPPHLDFSKKETVNKLGVFSLEDTADVNRHFSRPDVRDFLPRDLKTAWEINPSENSRDSMTLVLIKISTLDKSAPINGNCINRVSVNETETGSGIIIEMNEYYTRILSRLTYENLGRHLAILIDNTVYYNLYIDQETENGLFKIPGSYTYREAEDQSIILSSGSFPQYSVKIKEIN